MLFSLGNDFKVLAVDIRPVPLEVGGFHMVGCLAVLEASGFQIIEGQVCLGLLADGMHELVAQ